MKNKKISISVIIPYYNAQRTIYKCLASVINQSYKPLEVILIDDGSTDNSHNIVGEIIKENTTSISIISLKQNNLGPSSARNYGISLAQGDYISFLDSDDEWSIDKLQHQVLCLDNDKSIDLLSTSSRKRKTKIYYISYNMLLIKNYIRTSSCIVKRNIIEQFLFDEKMSFSEDYRLWLNIVYYHKAALLCGYKDVKRISSKDSYVRNSLSANLKDMLRGELSNYAYQYKQKRISYIKCQVLRIYSSLKYIRRVIIKLVSK